MPTRRRAAAAAFLLALVAPGMVATPTHGSAGASYATPSERAPEVLRRVVWDPFVRGGRGIHLRSAEVDGSDPRVVYDFPRGFTMQLNLDPSGRRVAFGTCCSDRFPQLVIAPVLGGDSLEPLARHPHLTAVGGIGWRPDGGRLAFEAITERGGKRVVSIWTIRPGGSGLRRVLERGEVGPDIELHTNDALAWTRDGVLYSDGKNLRAARRGRSRLVMRNVFEVRISGDQQHIVVERGERGRTSVWVAEPDGSAAERLFVNGRLGDGSRYYDVTPSFDGTELLAQLFGTAQDGSDNGLVRWRTSERPDTAVTIGPAGDVMSATWN